MKKYKFAIISPCKNEDGNIKIFIDELKKLKKENNLDFSLLLIDDGSTDKTWDTICREKLDNDFIKAIKLSRTFGKESAIDAGLNHVENNLDFYIIIDSDLQHPISVIPTLIKSYKVVEIVNTHRIDFKEGLLRETFSKLFYKVLKNFSEIKIISKTTDFMLISNKVRNKYVEIQEIDKTFRILINWLGFNSKSIPIKINYRKSGVSKYNFFNLFRLATNTISSFSIFPIKVIGYIGLAMSILSSILIIFFIINYFFSLTYFSWQTQFIILQILLSGLTMTSVGLLGIYVSKILKNSNKRPNYIIEKEI
jgi:dolichol-phosphate mannosyltransferase